MHDIEIIKERILAALPDVKIKQLRVVHPGVDDDGLWFCSREGKEDDLQLESWTHDVPFIVESSTSCVTTKSIDETVRAVLAFFAAEKPNQAPEPTPPSRRGSS